MSELLSMILSRNNMLEAYKQVKTNKGSAGIDGNYRTDGRLSPSKLTRNKTAYQGEEG